jgi:2-polyprenyl-3-methyl-5-hydroxy-6-metoxy-1,4-benzoquinol methylase
MTTELPEIVRSFEHEVTSHLRSLGEDPESKPVRTTIATNSTLIEQRGQPLARLLCETLGRGELSGVRVLDFGCGYGALSVLLAMQGASVVGVDAESERLEIGRRIAAEHGLPVELRAARMERPNLPHASFDAVLVNNSLCYLVEQDARTRALEEAFRAMRPGAVILVRDPNRLHPRDHFTGRWLIGTLSPQAADAASRALGRRRSLVRLRTPRSTCRELNRVGFVATEIASPGGALRRTLAGYNLVIARRPLA